MEFAVAFKRIPKSKWVALKTSLDNVFFYNIQSKITSWEIPGELEEFMMHAFAPEDDEQVQEKLLEKQNHGISIIYNILEASIELLKRMIAVAGLSPFGDWELEKIKIKDEAFQQLKLSDKVKRNVFHEYCTEKAQEEIKAREENRILIKEKFFAFLDSQNVSHQLTWNECQKRFKRHAEFMSLPIQEREAIFQQWIVNSKERAERKKTELRNTLIMEFYQLLQDIPQESLVLGWKKTKKELEKLEPNFYKKFKSLEDKAELFLEWKRNQGL